jgi:hypothetical protein
MRDSAQGNSQPDPFFCLRWWSYAGNWGHREWLAFLNFMSTRFGPFDADQLGMLLEREKTRYHKGQYITPERELKPSIKALRRRKAELLDAYLCVDFRCRLAGP